MNPEEIHEPGPDPNYVRPGPDARRTVETALKRAHDPDVELRIVEGFLERGAGFAAFLALPDTAAEDPTVIQQFERSYAQAWEDVDHLIEDSLDALGWSREVTELKKAQGIPDNYLIWNRDALIAHLHDVYSLVQLDGWTHAFHK